MTTRGNCPKCYPAEPAPIILAPDTRAVLVRLTEEYLEGCGFPHASTFARQMVQTIVPDNNRWPAEPAELEYLQLITEEINRLAFPEALQPAVDTLEETVAVAVKAAADYAVALQESDRCHA
jgi:hypothetical protein